MDTVLYYTLSTISQTLAGGFGFLVAVVLYRLQTISSSLPELANHSLSGGSRGQEVAEASKAATLGNWSRFIEIVKSMEFSDIPAGFAPERSFELLQRSLATLASIKKDLRMSLLATYVTIANSLVLLAATPIIASTYWLSVPCLVFMVVSALICLATFYILVRSVAI